MSKVLLIASDNDFGRRIQALPNHQVASISKSRFDKDGLRFLENFGAKDTPDVIVLGDEITLDAALNCAQHIDAKHPLLNVVIVSEPEADTLLRAMRVGIRDVVSTTMSDAELQVLLLRAADVASIKSRADVNADDSEQNRRRIIVVASPKGGVGKTTLSSNLAVGLAGLDPMQTVLVDLDLQFGDVATALDLKPTYTLADAFAVPQASDSLILKSFLAVHPAGFYALCGAESPAANEKVTSAQVRDLLRQLSRQFKYVVVDTAAGLDDQTLAALEEATDLILVSSMDVSCVRAVRKAVALLTQVNLLPAQRHVVLNFADRHSGMTVRDAERGIGLPVNVVVPRSQDVPIAGNRGEPILLQKRGGSVHKSLRAIVKRFRGETSLPKGQAHRGLEVA